METLQVRTGEVRLQILDDQGNKRGIFHFNPNDIESAKRIVHLQSELDEKEKEYDARAEKAETDEEKVDLLAETVGYFKGLVDEIFYEGASQDVFGDAMTLNMFDDFFSGIMPYYQKSSQARMAEFEKKGRGKSKNMPKEEKEAIAKVEKEVKSSRTTTTRAKKTATTD